MKYSKCLAIFYHKWFRDCHDSAVYCLEHEDKIRAEKYLEDSRKYFDIINENWDDIEAELSKETLEEMKARWSKV